MRTVDDLVLFIQKNWGKLPSCVRCTTPLSEKGGGICSGCHSFYCGKECQVEAHHQFACIGGRTKKQQRLLDEKEKEEEEESEWEKRYKVDDDYIPLIYEKINRDIWTLIEKWLSVQDIQNLRLVSKDMLRLMRYALLRRFRVIISDEMLEDPRSREIILAADAIQVSDREQLRRILSLGSLQCTDLKFSQGFNEWLYANDFPPRIQKLRMGTAFTQGFEKLPDSLKVLHFPGKFFNQSLVLPSGLKELILSEHFNRPIELPTSLEYLVLGRLFNQSLTMLPNLFHLELGGYRQSNLLSPSLTYLDMGRFVNEFDQLPPKLITLIFSKNFDRPLPPGVIPNGVQSVTFKELYNQPFFLGTFPPSVLRIKFLQGSLYNHPLILPRNLQELILSDGYNHPFQVNSFPSSLKRLSLGSNYNHPIGSGVLSDTQLEKLQYGANYNHPIQLKSLPTTLRLLVFGEHFNQPIGPGVLPTNLKEVLFGAEYNQPIGVSTFPAALRILKFGLRFNRSVGPGILPTGLEILIFGPLFSQRLAIGSLPASLKELELGTSYHHQLEIGLLPPQLETLRLLSQIFHYKIEENVLPNSLRELEMMPLPFNIDVVLPVGKWKIAINNIGQRQKFKRLQ